MGKNEKKDWPLKTASLTVMLVYLGITMFFILVGINFFFVVVLFPSEFSKDFDFIPMLLIAGGIIFLFLFLRRLVRYRRKKRAEGRIRGVDWKSLLKPLLIVLAMNALLIFGLAFFVKVTFQAEPTREEYILGLAYSIALSYYFSSIPIIMAAWFKFAPFFAAIWVAFHIRLLHMYKIFKKKAKPKIHKIFVHDIPQELSLYMSLQRSFTGMAFSIVFVTSLINYFFPNVVHGVNWIEWLATVVNPGHVPAYIPLEGTIWAGTSPISFSEAMNLFVYGERAFTLYCIFYVLITIIPMLFSYVFWSWLLPATWLLDDAGIVYFRSNTKRRRPPVMKSVGSWFLGMVKPLAGGSAIISYLRFVYEQQQVLFNLQGIGILGLVQFSIIIYALPILITMITVFLLITFQESQFDRLKTVVYKKLKKMKIDPRIVDIRFTKTERFQEDTLIDHVTRKGPGARSLREMVSDFADTYELDMTEPMPYSRMKDEPVDKKEVVSIDEDHDKEDDDGVTFIKVKD